MEEIKWICVNYKWDENGSFMTDTLAWKRTDSIKFLCDGTNKNWRHWRDKIGWRCIKFKVTITPI